MGRKMRDGSGRITSDHRLIRPTVRLVLLFYFTVVSVVAGAVDIVRVPADAATLENAAAIVPDGGIIEISAGSYESPVGGVRLRNLGKSFTIRAAEGAAVTLTGAGVNPVLRFRNSVPITDHTIVFEDLTFSNGHSTTDGIAGGVTLSRAVATFRRCRFENSSSDALVTGGGGAAVFTNSTAHFIDCVWSGNSATNEGGGLRVGEGSSAYIHRGQFIGNRVDLPNHRHSAAGGGLHITNSTVWLSNSRFYQNRAGYVGGGLYIIGTWADPVGTPAAMVFVANCSFIENVASPDATIVPPSPAVGGGLHAEDQATASIFNSRFENNTARAGGGLSAYRAIVEIDDSVFDRNVAVVTDRAGSGVGGAIFGSSNDGADATTNFGEFNRRPSSVTVKDSLFFGDPQATATKGGCIFLEGDSNRTFGVGGMEQMGSISENRASMTVEGSVFTGCGATKSDQGEGNGGGMLVGLTNLSVTDSLFTGCTTSGQWSGGAAIRALILCDVTVNGSTFAANTGDWSGAVNISGSQIQMIDSKFFDNQLINGTQGSALFTGPEQSIYGQNNDVSGTVSGCAFSRNENIAVGESDFDAGPKNDVVYDDNDFYTMPPTGGLVFSNWLTGTETVSGLNGLTVLRAVGNTDKSTVNNTDLPSVSEIGTLIAAPQSVLSTHASGDPTPPATTWLGYAWEGVSASINGSVLGNHSGILAAVAGPHTLAVGSEQYPATVFAPASPSATLVPDPRAIAGGETSDLDFALTSSTFLGASLDREVTSILGGSTGFRTVQPVATRTYIFYGLAEEGGAVAEATVWVDEVPDDTIFQDGFESGDTDAWSSVVGE